MQEGAALDRWYITVKIEEKEVSKGMLAERCPSREFMCVTQNAQSIIVAVRSSRVLKVLNCRSYLQNFL